MSSGVLLLAACAPKSPPLMVPAGTVWNPAGWIVAEAGSERGTRAGIVVLDRRRQQGAAVPAYQLDFLGNGQLPLSPPIALRTTPAGCDLTDRALTGLLAGTPKDAVTLEFGADSAWPLGRQAVGTLGLPSIARQTVVLDLGRHRAAFLPTGLASEVGRRIEWSGVTVDDDQLHAWVHMARGDSVRTLLDFGTLPVPALASPQRFTSLTGQQPTDDRNRRVAYPVCGDTIVVALAPSAVPLSIGPRRLGRTEVGVIVHAPAWINADAWPAGTELILGSAVFAGREAVVIEVERKRIGWVR